MARRERLPSARRLCALLTCLGLVTWSGCSDDDPPGPLALTGVSLSQSWGDAPLSVVFTFQVQNQAAGGLTCSVDQDGDGVGDTTPAPCTPNTGVSHVFTTAGRYTPRLVVADALGRSVTSSPLKVYANGVQWREGVLRPEASAGFVSAKVDPGSVTLTYSGQPPAIAAGNVLWGTSQDGYLRRVTSVTVSGSTVVASTTQAKVVDAIKSGFVGALGYKHRFGGIRCVEGCSGLVIEKGGTFFSAGDSATATLKLPDITLPDGSKVEDPEVELALTVDELVLDVGILEGVKEFKVKLTLTADAKVEVIFLDSKVGPFKKPLTTVALGTIPVGPLLLVPMVQPALELSADLGFKLSVTSGVKIGASGSLVYKKGQATSAEVTPSLTPYLTTSLGQAFKEGWLKVAIAPKLSTKLFGVVGHYVEPEVFTKGTLAAKAGQGLCLDATAGLDVSFGGEINVLDLVKVEAKVTKSIAEGNFFHKCTGALPDGGTSKLDAGPDRGIADAAWPDAARPDALRPDAAPDSYKPPSCAPSNCTGCCQGGVCQGGTSDTACGKGGASCVACSPPTTTCQSGACVAKPPSCAPSNCTGCCQGGVCQGGTSDTACGKGGASCVACSPPTTTCQSGACQSSSCAVSLSSPSSGATVSLSGQKFVWNQPCSGSVEVVICDTASTSCAGSPVCIAYVSKKYANYSGGSGTGWKGDFSCSKSMSQGTTYYWLVSSKWGYTSFSPFTAGP